MIIVNSQLDAQFFFVCLFLFSTCFGQPYTHHQENYCINATPGLYQSERNLQSKCLKCNQSAIKKQFFFFTGNLEFGEEGACIPNKPDCVILIFLLAILFGYNFEAFELSETS